MRELFPLRPIQIIDTSFILCKKTFVRFFLISLLVVMPLQIIAWIIEVSASDSTNNFSGRTRLLAVMYQCFIVGISIVITSNLFGKRASKEYCNEYLGRNYSTNFSKSRIVILVIQVLYQVLILAFCILTRYFLGRMLDDDGANVLSLALLILFVVIWSGLTLRKSFAIPISINENASGKNLKKRLKAINRYSWGTLFGTFCFCWLLVLVLVTPVLTVLQIVISKDYVKTSIGELALLNVIFALVVSFICMIYSYILVVVYFNSRVSYEGFDISVSLDDLELEGRTRGELLNIKS